MRTIDNPTNDTLERLRAATTTSAALPRAIAALEELVRDSDRWDTGLSATAAEALSDLACDRVYDVADPSARAEDPSYFGEERAIEEINNALARIERSQNAG